MPQVSDFSELFFLALVILVALAFIIALWRAGKPRESARTSLGWAAVAAILTSIWLGGSAFIARSGVLGEFQRRPPPFLIFVGLLSIATAAVALAPVGKRMIIGIDIRWLIGFQAFRIPLEFLLHRLYLEGVVPAQMTYAGMNFDILSGALALAIVIWGSLHEPPRWAILLFNLVGLALLINIVTIAILSTPTPLRLFFNEPANTFVAYSPFVWLPAFLVQAAWFGHLLVFRWLRRPRTEFQHIR
jgi:hypothetical protein